MVRRLFLVIVLASLMLAIPAAVLAADNVLWRRIEGRGFRPGHQNYAFSSGKQIAERLSPGYQTFVPAVRLWRSDMAFVPAGEFQMGCSPDDLDFYCGYTDGPTHTVYLDAYLIDKYEVTNARYQMCVAAGGCQPAEDAGYADPAQAMYPVDHAGWLEAEDFCKWEGKRLPSEAEWEKAARGSGIPQRYPWGSAPATCMQANISYWDWDGEVYVTRHCVGGTTPVGSYPSSASPYGVLDLAGNVSEWVEDAYHRAYYSMSPTANPPGPAAGAEHMLRGGSWEDLPVAVQTTSRAHALPKLRAGFRCASSLAGTLSISGTVRDENGYGVPGVTVSGGVSHTTSSDDGGHFSLHGLVTGTYTLTAARPLDTFSPFSQVVTIPPGANEVVFTCSSCRRFDPGEMLPIPAGDFQMGCDVFNSWGECEKDEGPLHTVSLSFYYIDEYEVSNERYAACMGAGACSPPQDSASFTRSMYFQNPDYASYPVVNVNWSQARNFCAWEGKRLPSEAEWEKAARGSLDLRRYPWGNQAPDCSRANFKLESYQPCYPDTVQVGGYPLGSSPYGIQDMAGSVWEWVNDWYASDYYCHGPEASSVDATVTCAEDDVPYLSPWPDPTGPVSGTYRVMRGGSLDLSWFGIRSSYRGGKYYSPDYASYFVGFRCASSVLTTYSASGTILDWTGRPVSGVTVSAGAGSLAVTQDDGSYTLEGLPAGKYLVKPQHDSYTFYPDHLWIQTPGPAGHQDFRAQLISTVRGRVLDGIGKPLPNVTINAGKEFHVLSGLDGTFSLYVPSPGVYTITASQAGNLFTPTLRAVIAPPGAVNQDFTCTDCPEGMLLIPAGTFYMGCDPYAQGLNCYGDQVPLHQVFLDDFFMDEYEATNSRYAACVAAGECSPPHYAASYTRNPYFGNAGFSNYPVLNVDWFQAKDMCEYEGKRLPTEGEWEKAARGSEDLRRYPWGTQAPDCTLLNYSPQTNEIDRCVGDTTEVGSYPGGASPYGILDMAGNVREWVADWYQANYYLESVFANPIGPASGPGRSVRGGALVDSAEYMEIFDRYGPAPEDWSMVSGFRCVMTP